MSTTSKKSQYQFAQSSDLFSYQGQVDGQRIHENWLIQNFNIMEYREKLYKAFQGSQERYLSRKGGKRVINQKSDIVSMASGDGDENLYTVFPKNPNLALQKRKITKDTRGVVSRQIERYFVVDNELITYFKKEKDVQFQKHIAIDNATVTIENVTAQFSKKFRWHDKKFDYRVAIELQTRNNFPIYYYTDDLNEAKVLAVRLRTAGQEPSKKEQIQMAIHQISVFEPVMRFHKIWEKLNKVYEQRLLRMISFQLMGINLIEVASTGWYHKEKMVKFWSNKVLKRQKKPVLVSTFKFGQLKAKSDANKYKSSLIMRENLKKLINLFKNRRKLRHSAMQKKIELIQNEQDRGIYCTGVKIQRGGSASVFEAARVKIDEQQFLKIEDDNNVNEKGEEDFFENQCKPFKFSVDHIAYLATNFNPKSKKKKEQYTVRIYGRTVKESFDPSQTKNIAPYELNLDCHRRIPTELYQIIIHSIEIPYDVAKRFSGLADIRVRLSQFQSDESRFYAKSSPYRIEIPKESEDKKDLVIDCENFMFTFDKLRPDNEGEYLKIDLLLGRSAVPLKLAMKELEYEEEIKGETQIQYFNQKNASVTIKNSKGSKFKVTYSVNKGKNANNIIPHYREGNRILIGKWVLYNKTKPCQVKALNKDLTLDLTIQAKEFPNIAMSKVTLIEKYGVNQYDLDNLPYVVKNSEHSWVIEFNTKNQRILNIIHQGIRNRQADLVYKKKVQKSYYKNKDQKLSEIEGNILVAVLEGKNLMAKSECNTLVKISMQPKSYDKSGKEKQNNIEMLQFETNVIERTNNPSWVTKEYPVGRVFDLGVFNKDRESQTITFQVFNLLSNKKEQALGSASIESKDMVDIMQPLKDLSLILEGGPSGYGFLSVQVLFIPKKATRMKYELIEDLSVFKSPEQYLHYKYLLKSFDHDSSNYLLPVQNYKPNFVDFCFTLIYKNQIYVQDEIETNVNFKSPLLLLHNKMPDKSSSPAIAQLFDILSMPDEKVAQVLKLVNSHRPELEQGVLIFKHLWRFRSLIPKQTSYIQLQQKFWSQFIQELQNQNQSSSAYLDSIGAMEQDILANDESFVYKETQQQQSQLQSSQKSKWFWQKEEVFTALVSPSRAGNNIFGDEAALNLMKSSLMLRSIWENESNQRYADAFHLIQQGVPDSMRVAVWKDLLSISVIEYQETKIFQKKNSLNYDNSKTLYQNYKDLAAKNDCLAFRQIDEDIENFQFPHQFATNQDIVDRVIELNRQKRKMRNILRALMLWSKTKKIEGKIASFSYTKGLMQILQRILTLVHKVTFAKALSKEDKELEEQEEEDAFWIVNGMIRPIPSLFSIDVSCLIGGRLSVMRNEMTIFKAILRENLPNICDKLRVMGLPVESLIYDHIGSFYSNVFQSEVVYRLWDIIIFNMSTKNKIDRKRSLWYIMSPAFLLFRERQEDIMRCTTVNQVLDVYKNAGAMTYDPDWVISELRNLVKDIFVTGSQRFANRETDDGKGMGFSLFNNFIQKQKAMFSVDKAKLLEQTRANYEHDLSEIFNSIELENKEVAALIDLSSQPKQSQASYLDYMKWRTHIMAKFKKIALKAGFDDIEDDLYEFDEPDLAARENLDLSKINICLHQIQGLWGCGGLKVFRVKLSYGKSNKKENSDGRDFFSLEYYDSGDTYNASELMQMFHVYDYLEEYNFIKIEIIDPAKDDEVACDCIIDLRNVSANRFIKKWYQMRNENMTDNIESYRFPFPTLEVSFFLQSHTALQHNEMMEQKNSQMSHFVSSIKRKLPDRIDIFNKKNETEFVNMMKTDFQRIIKEELDGLRCFLPEELATSTVNDNYNYISDSDFGDISLENLQYLVKQCFFGEWNDKIESVYRLFVKEKGTSAGEKEKVESIMASPTAKDNEDIERPSHFGQTMLNALGMKTPSHVQSKTPSRAKNQSMFKEEKESMTMVKPNKKQSSGAKVPFSLRNFIVALVLMSHCTLNEKFDILYDFFDWNDGVADGLDLNSILILLKTIFERNLYYWPSHELFNLIELSFDRSVSLVYSAFWSKDNNISTNRSGLKLSKLLESPDTYLKKQSVLDESMIKTGLLSIDVTEEVQSTLSSYHRMFGTKNIDFNFDSTVFKKIEMLIKGGKQMVEITNKLQGEGGDGAIKTAKYRLVLFCSVSGERFMFEVPYDKDGVLIEDTSLNGEKDDLDEYLKRNVNKLYMQGRSNGISKREFMEQTESIPFLHDLVRVETFYRDRVQNTLKKKKKLEEEVIVLMSVGTLQLIFKFQSKVMKNVEGEFVKIKISEEEKEEKNQFGAAIISAYKVLMTGVFEEDVISDLRQRLVTAVKSAIQSGEDSVSKMQTMWNLNQMLEGTWNFMFRDTSKASDQKWRKAKEFERMVKFQGLSKDGQIVFKMEKQKLTQMIQGGVGKAGTGDGSEELFDVDWEQEGYDSYSIYKHQDNSYEWRPCKIVYKETISAFNQEKMNKQLKQQVSEMKFFYWIEFLHLKLMGQKILLKRKREEILMSSRYAREQQRNYDQQALKFVKNTYSNYQEAKDVKAEDKIQLLKKQK